MESPINLLDLADLLFYVCPLDQLPRHEASQEPSHSDLNESRSSNPQSRPT